MINWVEEHEESVDLDTSLFSVYEKIKKMVPKKIDNSFNDMDRDEYKLEIFLKLHKKTLTVRTINIFFPFTISLDPYIKKLIRDYLNQREMLGLPTNEQQGGLPNSKRSPLEWFLRQRVSGNVSPQLRAEQRSVSISRFILVPEQFREMTLSSLAVEQICHLLSLVDGIQRSNVDKYLETLRLENVNGKVLKNCDLHDLKLSLKMSFGDWELFKVVIVEMRENEEAMKSFPTQPLERRAPTDKPETNIAQNDSTLEQMVLEKEAMSGLVSSINEEARDDIEIEDENTNKKQMDRIYISAGFESLSRTQSGHLKSKSIPKLVVTSEDLGSDQETSFSRGRLSSSKESFMLRRQRSKSENPKEFDEMEEIDLFKLSNV